MGAAESTAANKDADSHHGHSHAPGEHHGHSHSHGGTSTPPTSGRIPAAMTAEQLRGAPGIIPSSHVQIPPSGTQWQPVAVTRDPINAVPSTSTAPATVPAVVPAAAVASAGPVVHPEPAAAAHIHTHHSHPQPHSHHPQAGPASVPVTAAARPAGTAATTTTTTTQAAQAAPVVSGAAFAPTKATAPHTLPETSHVEALKGVEFVPAVPLPTTTPGVPMTTVHTQATQSLPPIRPIEVVSTVAAGAAVGAGIAASRPAEPAPAPVVNPSLLPPPTASSTTTSTADTSTPVKAAVVAAAPASGRKAIPAGSKGVWEQVLQWASPLLPQGVITQWDPRTVADLVLAIPSAESFRASLQQRQLERKKRRKAQALENAEAVAAGKKAPLTSPTAGQAAVIRGQGGQTLSIPYEIASVLLSVDKSLSAMRLQWVPSRVSEDTFFVEYFTAVVVALHGQVEEREHTLTGKQGGPTVLDRVRAIDGTTATQPQPQTAQ